MSILSFLRGILSFFFRRRKPAPARGPQERRALEAQPAPPAASGERDAASAAPAATAGQGPVRGVPVLVAPVLTEKATVRQTEGWHTFAVVQAATKPAIKRAVERHFGVHVEKVRVLNVRGKVRRRGRIVGHSPGYRKAMVRLQAGEKIQPEQPLKA